MGSVHRQAPPSSVAPVVRRERAAEFGDFPQVFGRKYG
jgi:hypothetical protein